MLSSTAFLALFCAVPLLSNVRGASLLVEGVSDRTGISKKRLNEEASLQAAAKDYDPGCRQHCWDAGQFCGQVWFVHDNVMNEGKGGCSYIRTDHQMAFSYAEFNWEPMWMPDGSGKEPRVCCCYMTNGGGFPQMQCPFDPIMPKITHEPYPSQDAGTPYPPVTPSP
uniref:Uncharacterized protein n=1 Tax=Chromera velia CCMP2878 TaxID=1169474 RepID=A0A0G4FFM5_9ALVE|mmetsp:Transcript_24661/g.48373  ORF Transcript_24661/g.48373 Transcript_24661/m.48373 type:complete len:167 (+) Transcript_24661:187-687(+)|eukprot:Cvel_16631.t1-p1 / transcript=Cvel_16631.t1 / gene=Cvel_16631 / organism=Chromera_velia_CCMP2878 / gene_product=hypothetical protein / transcript_product=hypothetical protein / location=Cvel_scaffold1289:28409-28906(-) / protein_length=166 / sequence_SO=supercontig / SO=protein_coding / is_pseudo=false